MANPKHLKILKRGRHEWEFWRIEHSDIRPDLSGVDLSGADLTGPNYNHLNLSGVDLSRANLSRANLGNASLRGATLKGADFSSAILSDVDFKEADLDGINLTNSVLQRADFTDAVFRQVHLSLANLSYANLKGVTLIDTFLAYIDFTNADLTNADLAGKIIDGVDFTGANLTGANLAAATLTSVNFTYATLYRANLAAAKLMYTTFANNNLSEVIGLETVRHLAPSDIGVNTLSWSQGKIPEVFLRGCGLSDWQVEAAKLHWQELSNEEITNILYRAHDLRAHQAIQITPLFISYSHADGSFVDAIETHLNGRGVRFWRDVHNSTAGRLERQIDRAIRLNPTVLLVLSKHSVKSDWVEYEARLARKLELETGRDVLCPVALDDSWLTCRWPERLREQIMEYNVLDFSGWRDAERMQRMFSRLIEGLGLFYKSAIEEL